MKVAIFCVCRNESKLLPLWVNHYANQFGLENIYVFDNDSSDGCFDNVELINYEKVSFGESKIVERYGSHKYQIIWSFIKSKYIKLLEKYDYVANIDIDEFIIPNPDTYYDLKHYLELMKRDYVRCTGYEVVQQRKEESALDWSRPVLDQRSYWIRQSNVDKPSITTKKLNWELANHYIIGKKDEETEQDLILFHLHRVDFDNYKKKYLIIDERIKSDNSFVKLYGGYPLFWQEAEMIRNFDDVNANFSRGGVTSTFIKIPEKYKGTF